jgi:SAM-dependent methyltransferase
MNETAAATAIERDARESPPYCLRDGVFVRDSRLVAHDTEQYDTRGYQVLSEMQRRHFWYRGRHKLLASAVRKHWPAARRNGSRVIDLGAGCGGWMAHVAASQLFPDSELALGDSSLVALDAARQLGGGRVQLFQIDLLDLGFERRWDVAFLLDVIEHLEDDVAAMRNAFNALSPGGLLFVTVPALQAFWSWNDEVVKHKRRYSAKQLSTVAREAGFSIVDARYFMFLLSPLLLLSRHLSRPRLEEMTEEQKWATIEKTHRVPVTPVNALLSAVLALETPINEWFKFPWGTSLLGVFQRPA